MYLRDVPAAYGAMLSGYTAAIIGVPAAMAPSTAFDSAWARCLEITLGIACATLVSRLVLPRRAGDALQATLDAAMAAGRQWTVDVLRGQGEAANGLADRRTLLADIVQLETRSSRTRSTTRRRSARRRTAIRHLQARLMMLLSVLVAIHDRLAILARAAAPIIVALLQPILDRVAMRLPPDGDRGGPWGRPGTSRPANITPRPAGLPALQQDGDQLLVHTILLRLEEVQALAGELWRRRARLLGDVSERGR